MGQEVPKSAASEFARIGRLLFTGGLNNSHSGNLSMRIGDRVVITRRGAMLADLDREDLVSVGVGPDDSRTSLASTEVRVHRAIYHATTALAVVHTHPRSATALSMLGRDILPADVEGRHYFERVPVLTSAQEVGSEGLGRELGRLLAEFPIVVVRGHGAFAAAESLERGLHLSHALEWSCDILLRCAALGMSMEELLGEDRTGDR
ncbi:MAG: class II aldolase/adducin family protein [bacterium]|nr:MAG: class II aldolase/adducin family protein [bacterium]